MNTTTRSLLAGVLRLADVQRSAEPPTINDEWDAAVGGEARLPRGPVTF